MWNNATLKPDFEGPFIEELYNHTGDHSFEMDMYENVNMATAYPKVCNVNWHENSHLLWCYFTSAHGWLRWCGGA